MSMTKGTPASSQIIFLEQMVEKQADRIAELEAALKPFAELGDNFSDSEVMESIRHARKVLGEKKDEH